MESEIEQLTQQLEQELGKGMDEAQPGDFGRFRDARNALYDLLDTASDMQWESDSCIEFASFRVLKTRVEARFLELQAFSNAQIPKAEPGSEDGQDYTWLPNVDAPASVDDLKSKLSDVRKALYTAAEALQKSGIIDHTKRWCAYLYATPDEMIASDSDLQSLKSLALSTIEDGCDEVFLQCAAQVSHATAVQINNLIKGTGNRDIYDRNKQKWRYRK